MATLYADYLRAGFGLVLTAGPLLVLDVADVVALLLGALALLFAWFGARTALRHLSRVELSKYGVALRGPVARRVPWADLDRMKLAYYAPRRSRDQGWLQLTLHAGDGAAIRLDSTLTGFDQVLAQASRAARAKALPLDAATHANLVALGLEPTDALSAPECSPDAETRVSRARW